MTNCWMMKMTLNDVSLIVPDWPAPPNVRAVQTTRLGGVSQTPYDSLNLGTHVGDNPLHVAANRQRLSDILPSEPIWMEQVHGTIVQDAALASCQPQADAAVTRHLDTVCTVMTADCLPVLLCDQAGTVVAAAHAGWRGLSMGVIERTVEAMHVPADQLLAWLGPAIGPDAFEVGEDVYQVFVNHDAKAAEAFEATEQTKWRADIYLLARQRLAALGVARVYGGEYCTFHDTRRFFSYRRDGACGRMASMIWLGR
jgi:YfiH family protein